MSGKKAGVHVSVFLPVHLRTRLGLFLLLPGYPSRTSTHRYTRLPQLTLSPRAPIHVPQRLLLALRVKDLQDILASLGKPKYGKKDELLGRVREVCCSSMLVAAAGGVQHVERVIKQKCVSIAVPTTCGHKRTSSGLPKPGTPAHRAHTSCAAKSAVDNGMWARAVASDPFWKAANEPNLQMTPGVVMHPTALRAQPGTRIQVLERPFSLTVPQALLLRSQPQVYELQLQCLLNDDEVPARLHWPFLVGRFRRVHRVCASRNSSICSIA